MAPISYSDDDFRRFKSFIEPAATLKKHGFIVQLLTDAELLMRRRCRGCNKTFSQLSRKNPRIVQPVSESEFVKGPISVTTQPHVSAPNTLSTKEQPCETLEVQGKENPKYRCKYHEGRMVAKRWSCCGQNATATPCSGAHEHVPRAQKLEELSELYQFYPTPRLPPKNNDIRAAVALDCEMGTAVSGDSELIRVTLIDYFSGQTLVDKLVQPDVPMQHLRTRFSGVSWSDLRRAHSDGTILRGKAGARSAVWEFVGRETIVVGHGLSNDLRALRWIHASVVDSFVVECNRAPGKEVTDNDKGSEMVTTEKSWEPDIGDVSAKLHSLSVGSQGVQGIQGGRGDSTPLTVTGEKCHSGVALHKPGNRSLKALAMKYLARDIQTEGRRGHDSLEDAVAARDIIHWNVLHFDAAEEV